jgi:hypothetical protein
MRNWNSEADFQSFMPSEITDFLVDVLIILKEESTNICASGKLVIPRYKIKDRQILL